MEKTARKPVKIYVLDEHPIVHLGFLYLAQKEKGLELCGHSSSPDEALTSIARLRPDLVISEISFGGIRGVQLVKQIKSRYPTLPVLIFSRFDESVFAERALRAGAQGFIRKHEDFPTILQAIQAAHQQKIHVSRGISQRVLRRLTGTTEPDGPKNLEKLSDRELEVFDLIGQGLATRQIARNLNLSDKTIQSYREHIKQKLGLASARELLQLAIQWGHRDSLS